MSNTEFMRAQQYIEAKRLAAENGLQLRVSSQGEFKLAAPGWVLTLTPGFGRIYRGRNQAAPVLELEKGWNVLAAVQAAVKAIEQEPRLLDKPVRRAVPAEPGGRALTPAVMRFCDMSRSGPEQFSRLMRGLDDDGVAMEVVLSSRPDLGESKWEVMLRQVDMKNPGEPQDCVVLPGRILSTDRELRKVLWALSGLEADWPN